MSAHMPTQISRFANERVVLTTNVSDAHDPFKRTWEKQQLAEEVTRICHSKRMLIVLDEDQPSGHVHKAATIIQVFFAGLLPSRNKLSGVSMEENTKPKRNHCTLFHALCANIRRVVRVRRVLKRAIRTYTEKRRKRIQGLLGAWTQQEFASQRSMGLSHGFLDYCVLFVPQHLKVRAIKSFYLQVCHKFLASLRKFRAKDPRAQNRWHENFYKNAVKCRRVSSRSFRVLKLFFLLMTHKPENRLQLNVGATILNFIMIHARIEYIPTLLKSRLEAYFRWRGERRKEELTLRSASHSTLKLASETSSENLSKTSSPIPPAKSSGSPSQTPSPKGLTTFEELSFDEQGIEDALRLMMDAGLLNSDGSFAPLPPFGGVSGDGWLPKEYGAESWTHPSFLKGSGDNFRDENAEPLPTTTSEEEPHHESLVRFLVEPNAPPHLLPFGGYIEDDHEVLEWWLSSRLQHREDMPEKDPFLSRPQLKGSVIAPLLPQKNAYWDGATSNILSSLRALFAAADIGRGWKAKSKGNAVQFKRKAKTDEENASNAPHAEVAEKRRLAARQLRTQLEKEAVVSAIRTSDSGDALLRLMKEDDESIDQEKLKQVAEAAEEQRKQSFHRQYDLRGDDWISADEWQGQMLCVSVPTEEKSVTMTQRLRRHARDSRRTLEKDCAELKRRTIAALAMASSTPTVRSRRLEILERKRKSADDLTASFQSSKLIPKVPLGDRPGAHRSTQEFGPVSARPVTSAGVPLKPMIPMPPPSFPDTTDLRRTHYTSTDESKYVNPPIGKALMPRVGNSAQLQHRIRSNRLKGRIQRDPTDPYPLLRRYLDVPLEVDVRPIAVGRAQLAFSRHRSLQSTTPVLKAAEKRVL